MTLFNDSNISVEGGIRDFVYTDILSPITNIIGDWFYLVFVLYTFYLIYLKSGDSQSVLISGMIMFVLLVGTGTSAVLGMISQEVGLKLGAILALCLTAILYKLYKSKSGDY